MFGIDAIYIVPVVFVIYGLFCRSPSEFALVLGAFILGLFIKV